MTRTPPEIRKEVSGEEVGKEEKSPKMMKKRKANDSPLIVRQAAIKLKKKIDELVKYGKANKNVHVEVKKTANELQLLINRAIGGCGVEDREGQVRLDAIIRVNETEEREKGKRLYEGVEDIIEKLAALGIKEIGVKGYVIDKPELIGRLLEYLSRGVNLKSVIYGEGNIEDRVNRDRIINKDTMFVKLKDDVRDKAYGEEKGGKRQDKGEGDEVPGDEGD
ncbi:hypothetical protein FQA39_LY04138 [Lamprigera yunnana]|nr:hypothetical protein FQA39_LY04138 [Lamprigera yunnana]